MMPPPSFGPPPVVEAPAPDLQESAPQARSLFGWILLLLIGLFLVGVALAEYFSQDPGQSGTVETVQFRQVYVVLEGQKRLAEMSGTQLPPATKKQALDQLEPMRRRMARSAAKSEDSALGEAVLARELGKAPAPASLANLKDSKDEGKKAYALAISKPTLALAEAKAAGQKLKGESFQTELARRQLLDKAGQKDAFKDLIPLDDVLRFAGVAVAGTAAFGVGLVALVTGWVLASSGKWKTRMLPPQGLSLADADRYAMRMALYLAIFVGGSLFISLAVQGLGDSFPSGLKMMLPLLAVTVFTILMLKMPIGGISDGLKRVMGDTTKLGRQVAIGAAGFFANIPILIVITLIVTFVTSPLQDRLPTPSHPVNSLVAEGGLLTLLAVYITAGILAPIVEEITFRGLLSPALSRVWNVAGAILVQGIFFAAIHPQGPLAWPMLAGIGCMAAYLSYKEGSLIPAIVMHAIHNTAVLTLGLSIF